MIVVIIIMMVTTCGNLPAALAGISAAKPKSPTIAVNFVGLLRINILVKTIKMIIMLVMMMGRTTHYDHEDVEDHEYDDQLNQLCWTDNDHDGID